MLTRTVVSSLLGTNCYLLADDRGRAVVVDPGLGVADEVRRLVEAEHLTVHGVLVTHGHVDHTWDVAEVCAAFDVALHVHDGDAHRIEEPFATLGPLGPQLEQLADAAGSSYRAPHAVVPFRAADDGSVDLLLAGPDGPLVVTGLHAPGHTEGSTVYLWDGAALTGDVLFAGTVGRTDLPGGDPEAMGRSLTRLADLPPATAVLPGHGPSSTVAAELAANPYLRPITGGPR